MAMSASKEYLNVEEQEIGSSDGDVESGEVLQGRRRRVGLKVACCLAAVGLGLYVNRVSGKHDGSSHQEFTSFITAFEAAAPSQCGVMEPDTDYVEYSGWGMNYDHIPDAEMCCAMCQGVPKCKAFVWVADAGLDGCPSQCWLKGGEPVEKKQKSGVIAGVIPERITWEMTPQKPEPEQIAQDQDSTGLFCFSLMLPFGYETTLLAWQFENQASIFACDKYAVYTNKTIEIGVGTGVFTRVVDSDLHCGLGGDSYSALNAWIFISVWKQVIVDGYYLEYPWTVKVDPDAVFFPGRLRPLLANYYGQPLVNNCRYGMHGPMEVFGKAAITALAGDYAASADGKAPKTCVEGQHFGLWGEDMFMYQCLTKILQVTGGQEPALESRLMCEAHCDCDQWYWCKNGTDRVSFHPFKSVDSYSNCMANAESVGPLAPQ